MIYGNIVGNVSGENAGVQYTSHAVPAREVPVPTPTPTPSSKSARLPRIFLCHANEDKPQVRQVYQRLKAEGFQPWLDEEDLLPGQLWNQEIRRALKNSDFILIFFSQNSVLKRGYVQREMKLALEVWEEMPEGQIHTIPVRLDDCTIPEQFQGFQRVDLFRAGGFERIIRAIRFQQSQHVPQGSLRQPAQEEREGAIRRHITKQIEVLRYAPGGPVVLYGDLTKQVPETFLTEEIVRVVEQMRLDGIIEFNGPLDPHFTDIRLLPQWNSVQNPQLQRLLVASEHALASGDLTTSMAGTKSAFDAIVSAIGAEYAEVTDRTNPSSFPSFLFATEQLGLSRADARKCREITNAISLGIADSGTWRLVPPSDKTDEDSRSEMTFVLTSDTI
jgi:hypothetical protein